MVIVNSAVSFPALFLALTLKEYVPDFVGVPEISPVALSRVRPLENFPDLLPLMSPPLASGNLHKVLEVLQNWYIIFNFSDNDRAIEFLNAAGIKMCGMETFRHCRNSYIFRSARIS